MLRMRSMSDYLRGTAVWVKVGLQTRNDFTGKTDLSCRAIDVKIDYTVGLRHGRSEFGSDKPWKSDTSLKQDSEYPEIGWDTSAGMAITDDKY